MNYLKAAAVLALPGDTLSQLLLNEGYRHCFLFTDLANPTSNKIYKAIGYEQVCDMDEYGFGPMLHDGGGDTA